MCRSLKSLILVKLVFILEASIRVCRKELEVLLNIHDRSTIQHSLQNQMRFLEVGSIVFDHAGVRAADYVRA